MPVTTNYITDLGNVFVSYDDIAASQPIATLVFTGTSSSNNIYFYNNSFYPSTYTVPENTNLTLIVNKIGYQVSCYVSGQNTFFYTKGTYSLVNSTTTSSVIVQNVAPLILDTTSGTSTTGITIGNAWSVQANVPTSTGGQVITTNNNVFYGTGGNWYYNTINNTVEWNEIANYSSIAYSTSYNGAWAFAIMNNEDVYNTFWINSIASDFSSFSYYSFDVAYVIASSSAIQYTAGVFSVLIGFSASAYNVYFGNVSIDSGNTETNTYLNYINIGNSGGAYVSMSASAQYQLVATTDGYISYMNTAISNSFTASNIQASTNVFTSICMSALSEYAVASTSNAGCFISTDYGVTWTALTIQTSSPYTIYSNISLSYNGQNIIATGNNGTDYYTFYSSDYGTTFTQSKNAGNISSSCMSPTGLYAVASGPSGVCVSYN